MDGSDTPKCPVVHGATNMGMRGNKDWWPNQQNAFNIKIISTILGSLVIISYIKASVMKYKKKQKNQT